MDERPFRIMRHHYHYPKWMKGHGVETFAWCIARWSDSYFTKDFCVTLSQLDWWLCNWYLIFRIWPYLNPRPLGREYHDVTTLQGAILLPVAFWIKISWWSCKWLMKFQDSAWKWNCNVLVQCYSSIPVQDLWSQCWHNSCNLSLNNTEHVVGHMFTIKLDLWS